MIKCKQRGPQTGLSRDAQIKYCSNNSFNGHRLTLLPGGPGGPASPDGPGGP